MKDVVDWLAANYKLVAYVVCTFIVLIINLIPKRVKVLDTVKETILQMLPELIDKVEEPGKGPEKRKAVIEMCCAAVSKLFPGVQVSHYYGFISKAIEAILKTPQKKG